MYEIFEKLLAVKGVTAYQVAKETGITPSMFSHWKSGIYVPKLDKLQKIADYFDVTIDQLMGLSKTIIDIEDMAYMEVIKEAKTEGFSPEDVRAALNLLRIARGCTK